MDNFLQNSLNIATANINGLGEPLSFYFCVQKTIARTPFALGIRINQGRNTLLALNLYSQTGLRERAQDRLNAPTEVPPLGAIILDAAEDQLAELLKDIHQQFYLAHPRGFTTIGGQNWQADWNFFTRIYCSYQPGDWRTCHALRKHDLISTRFCGPDNAVLPFSSIYTLLLDLQYRQHDFIKDKPANRQAYHHRALNFSHSLYLPTVHASVRQDPPLMQIAECITALNKARQSHAGYMATIPTHHQPRTGKRRRAA